MVFVRSAFSNMQMKLKQKKQVEIIAIINWKVRDRI